MTRYTNTESSCYDLVVYSFAQVKERFLEFLILRTSQNNASDVTSWRYSRFQAKMTNPDYQFRDNLQSMHRKMRE